MTSLDTIRQEIRDRRSRAQMVEDRHDAYRRARTADELHGERPVVTIRCSEKHQRGKPTLAKADLSPFGVLFVSRIAWAASDQLNLRPWARENYLGAGLDPGTFDRLMGDDLMLNNWLAQLQEWEQGIAPDGERWLIDTSPFTIREVLDLPSQNGRLALWVRCPRHLESPQEESAARIMDAARRFTAKRD